MLTLRVDGPSIGVPPKVYVVCGPTAGCGKAFLIGPEQCPHCGHPTMVRAATPIPSTAVRLLESLFNWEYGPMMNWR